MSVYSIGCTFPDTTTPLSNATSGWDVVYAVKYSTINAHLKANKPWAATYFGGNTPGVLSMVGNSYNVDGVASKLEVTRGAAGQEMYFMLSFVNVVVSESAAPPGTTIPVVTYPQIDALIKVVLKIGQSGTAGLKALKVDVDQPPTVLSVLTPDGGMVEPDVSQVMTWLCADPGVQAMFNVEIVQLYHKDYAEGVNIPWALPSAFSYATADLVTPDSDDGVLAVLGSVSGNTSGLAAQINPLAIPVDTDIDAVVLISPALASKSTFIEALNGQLGDAMLGPLSYSSSSGAISNDNDLTLYYGRDEHDLIMLLDGDSALSYTGEKYPASIPAGALRFTIARNAITAAITQATIKFDDYSIVLSVKYYFQIMANGDDIDIVLSGEPEITSRLVSAPRDTGNTWVKFGGMLVGLVVGELIVALADRAFGITGLVHKSKKRVNELALDFIAANEMAMGANGPVEINVDFFRKIGVSRVRDGGRAPAPAQPLTDAIRARTRFPEPSSFVIEPVQGRGQNIVRGRGQNIEMQPLLRPLQPARQQQGVVPRIQGVQLNARFLQNGLGVLPRVRVPRANMRQPQNGPGLLPRVQAPRGNVRLPQNGPGLIRRVQGPQPNARLPQNGPGFVPRGQGPRLNARLAQYRPGLVPGVQGPRLNAAVLQNGPGRPGQMPRPVNLRWQAEQRRLLNLQIRRGGQGLRRPLVRAPAAPVQQGVLPPTIGEGLIQLRLSILARCDEEVARGIAADVRKRTGHNLMEIASIEAMSPQQAEQAYKECVKTVERWFHAGKIADSSYLEIVSDMQARVGRARLGVFFQDRVRTERQVYATFGGSRQTVPEGLAAEVTRALETPNAAYSLSAIRRFITEAPRPTSVKVMGYGLYIAAVLLGQYGSQWAQDGFDALLPSQMKKDVDSLAGGNAEAGGNPTNLFLKTVNFPLMRRPDASAPAPKAVLQSAAVNGALILGVLISDPA